MRYAKSSIDNNRRVLRCLLALAAAALLAAAVLFIVSKNGREAENPLRIAHRAGEASVTVLDVGQGDCAVIIAGETVVMVDAGESYAAPGISAFLDANGITEIDYLVATHPHADHIGGFGPVFAGYDVAEILLPDLPESLIPTTKTYLAFLESAEAEGAPRTAAEDGAVIELALGRLRVLSDGGYSDLNDCSVVLMYEYGDIRFLLAGDAGRRVEEDLLSDGCSLSADILKAGHHGSGTSGSGAFLEAVAPEYVAVSCGEGNSYGHPDPDFLSRVEEDTDARLLRTDLDGSIVFITDGETVGVSTQKDAA